MDRTKQRVTGVACSALGAGWWLYSNLKTAADLPKDAGGIEKFMADPPMYLPWIVLAGFIVLVGWSFWPEKSTEPDSSRGQPAPSTTGDGSHAIGTIEGNATFLNVPSPKAGIAAHSGGTWVVRNNKFDGSGRLMDLGHLENLVFEDNEIGSPPRQDNRKGIFNNAPNHGTQTFNEYAQRPPFKLTEEVVASLIAEVGKAIDTTRLPLKLIGVASPDFSIPDRVKHQLEANGFKINEYIRCAEFVTYPKVQHPWEIRNMGTEIDLIVDANKNDFPRP